MPYDNTNTGAVYRNERKLEPNHPDYQGQCNVDGKDYWISIWCKEAGPQSKTPGLRFFSLSFRPKEARAAVAPRDDDLAPTPLAPAGASPAGARPAAPPKAAATPPAKPPPTEDDSSDVPF